MWSASINVTNRRTDRRTDVIRRHHRSIAIAWSGKNRSDAFARFHTLSGRTNTPRTRRRTWLHVATRRQAERQADGCCSIYTHRIVVAVKQPWKKTRQRPGCIISLLLPLAYSMLLLPESYPITEYLNGCRPLCMCTESFEALMYFPIGYACIAIKHCTIISISTFPGNSAWHCVSWLRKLNRRDTACGGVASQRLWKFDSFQEIYTNP